MPRNVGEPITTWQDENDPSNLMYLLKNCPALVTQLKKIQPEVLIKTERQLELEIRKKEEKRKFPRTLGYLKMRFWEEYRAAQSEQRHMRAEDIFAGICNKDYWNQIVMRNPIWLAWMISPPIDELVLQKEIIQLSMSKLRDVFDAPIITKKLRVRIRNGERQEYMEEEVNLPLVREIHGILKTMQDRVYGSVLQRTQSENKTLQINANLNRADTQKLGLEQKSLTSPDLTIDDILEFQQQLQRTQKLLETSALKAGSDLNAPAPITLEVEEEDDEINPLHSGNK